MNEIQPKFDDPPAVKTAVGKIAELAKLPENWDSYGSRPIQGAAIEKTTEHEAAALLGISVMTVKRDWEFAKAWLLSELCERLSGPRGGRGSFLP
jgi:hypothetical protein